MAFREGSGQSQTLVADHVDVNSIASIGHSTAFTAHTLGEVVLLHMIAGQFANGDSPGFGVKERRSQPSGRFHQSSPWGLAGCETTDGNRQVQRREEFGRVSQVLGHGCRHVFMVGLVQGHSVQGGGQDGDARASRVLFLD